MAEEKTVEESSAEEAATGEAIVRRPVIHREVDGEGVHVGFDDAVVKLTMVSGPDGTKRIHAEIRQLPPSIGFSYTVVGHELRTTSSGSTPGQVISKEKTPEAASADPDS